MLLCYWVLELVPVRPLLKLQLFFLSTLFLAIPTDLYLRYPLFGESTSSWKILLFIGTSPSVSNTQVSSTLQDLIIFPNKFTTFYAMLTMFRLSITQELESHTFSYNRSTPLLSSSSFVLLPEEASYLCITGPQCPFTSFCILSDFLVISPHSLKNHGFNQQLSLSTVSMSRGDIMRW